MSKEFQLGSIVELKKPHPCGNNEFKVTRLGADIKVRCTECNRTIMLPRQDFLKRLKNVKQF